MTDHQQVIPWVLAAIAKVKGQKQQPNEERISSVLLQSYGVEKDEALHHLQLCVDEGLVTVAMAKSCLLYTSPSPRDKRQSRMPSSA